MSLSGPLKGIRILDCTHVLSGPFGSTLLADMGADVIKVERPVDGDPVRSNGPPFNKGESAYFFSVNHNKRSICVDLKNPDGVEVINRLVANCDVFMENFRPGVMERLGLGYEDLIEIKPDIIYSSMTAFGRAGPYKNKPGFELIIQALTGVVDVTSPPNGPPAKIQLQMVDLCTGMILAYITLAALYHKQATGRGQRVDTSLMETTLSMIANLAHIYFMSGEVPTGMGTRNPQSMPSQAFKTKDSYVCTVISPNQWSRFCKALGRMEWIEHPQISDPSYRVMHYDQMVELIEAETITRTTEEWLKTFDEYQVAAAPINTMEQAFQDPGVINTGMVKTMMHPIAGQIQVLDKPWQMSDTPGGLRLPPPVLGYHTSEVLLENGFAGSEIEELKQKGAIWGN